MIYKKISLSSLIFLLITIISAQNYPNVKFSDLINPEKNNVILKPGMEYAYAYKIINTETEKQYGIRLKSDQDWSLADKGESEDVIEKIYMLVIKPKIFQRTNKRQTEIVYSFEPNKKIFSSTGGVENKSNFWLHPPRTGYFKILELCPFPYVKYPLQTGTEWQDKNSVGNYWSNPNWLEWNDRLLLDFNYKITGKEEIKTSKQVYECWVVESTATFEQGSSMLTAYFNENVGFVRLVYQTVNNMSIEFELREIRDFDPDIKIKDYYSQKYKEWQ